MHTGRFPALPTPGALPPYEREGSDAANLDPDRPRYRRRQFLLGAGCLAIGAVIPTGIGLVVGESGAPSSPASGVEALPDWAEEMRQLPAPELIDRAGEFEMNSCRHPGDRRLTPGFERLLRIALVSSHRQRDAAAACAVRSLARLDRMDLVEVWIRRLAKDPAFATAVRAAREELDSAALRRRSKQK